MFKLTSQFEPTGDQPEAIKELTQGLLDEVPGQVLLGVTGSGKTFTIANVIQEVQRPTLILSHNKTLAAQLYGEFKAFFPENAVEYFVSYYDYYQPEAYLPTTNTYIEKDLMINDEIDKLRLRATASLLSGRRDVIVISSVSCLYGMADPTAFGSNIIYLKRGLKIGRNQLLRRLVDALYVNNELEFKRGSFRAKGETVDIFPAIETFEGMAYRIEFWDDEIDRITSFSPQTGKTIDEMENLNIYLVGDLKYGRTVHSLLMAMRHFNPTFHFIAPEELKMPEEYKLYCKEHNIKYVEHTDFTEETIAEADILYMTRVQRERFTDLMEYERVKNVYILKNKMLEHTRPNLRILHPLPRVNEIAYDVDDNPKAYYFEQAHNGLFARQAIICDALGITLDDIK